MKTKRILSLVLIGVIGIFAILVVLGAVLPKDFNFNFDEPASIIVYKNEGIKINTFEKGTETYNAIMQKFNSGFKTTFLNALFQGKASKSVVTKVNDYQSLPYDLSSKQTDSLMYIEFVMNGPQNTSKHGNESLQLNLNERTYQYVVIEIKNSDSLVEINAYLRYGIERNTYSYVRYVTYAAHQDLFSYLNELSY